MTFTHRFHPSVLREYDIRGIVGETLSEADAEAVGRGFGTAVRGAGGTRLRSGLPQKGFSRLAPQGPRWDLTG